MHTCTKRQTTTTNKKNDSISLMLESMKSGHGSKSFAEVNENYLFLFFVSWWYLFSEGKAVLHTRTNLWEQRELSPSYSAEHASITRL